MTLRVCALAAAAVLFATGLALRDLEAIAIAVLLLGGLVLLRLRAGLVGRLTLALLFVDIFGWMAPAAYSNASHDGARTALAIPLALVGLCVIGVAAAARLPDRLVIGGAIALLIAAIAITVSASGNDTVIADPSSPSIAMLSAQGAKFSTAHLQVRGSTVSVVFHNKDLFWHTFTINKLEVSIKAPLGGTRVARFAAPPGTYEFYCAIPGHKAAGMQGTLTVS